MSGLAVDYSHTLLVLETPGLDWITNSEDHIKWRIRKTCEGVVHDLSIERRVRIRLFWEIEDCVGATELSVEEFTELLDSVFVRERNDQDLIKEIEASLWQIVIL